MDAAHFAALVRSVSSTSSRRMALRLVASTVFGGFAVLDPVSAAKKHHKGKKKHRKPEAEPPVTQSPPPPRSLDVAYECAGPGPAGFAGTNGNDRWAQRFVAGRSGSLRQIRFRVAKDSSSPGDWVVQLVKTVGTISPVPSHSPLDVLAANTIVDATVPEGESTLTASFAGPNLEKDTSYSAVLSRPGSTSWLALGHGADVCGGQFYSALGSDAFIGSSSGDIIVAVLVE